MIHDVKSLERLQRAIASRLVGAPETDDEHREGILHALDPDELLRSSRTLMRKRLSQTSALLPITRCLLGSSFDELFLQYATEMHVNGSKAALQDGAAFSEWLRRRLDDVPLPASVCKEQVAESCRFEGRLCDWRNSDWFFERERFSWDWRSTPPGGGPLGAGDVPRRTIRRWLWRLGPWVGGRVWG